MLTGFIWPRIGFCGDCCKHGYELTGSVMNGRFLDQLGGFSCIGLVDYFVIDLTILLKWILKMEIG
jgi:hypothetical protein